MKKMDGMRKKLGTENTDGDNTVLLLMDNDGLGWSWSKDSREEGDWIQEICRDILVRPMKSQERCPESRWK